jgi:dynein heavy chain 1, cytosolic
MKELQKDRVTQGWRKYTTSINSLTEWIVDFKKRLDQFSSLAKIKDYRMFRFLCSFIEKKGVWMGGLLFPEAYITATRQFIAQNNKWSLEELDLQVTLYENEPVDDCSFLVSGIIIAGANWSEMSKSLELTDELTSQLPTLKFKWVKGEKLVSAKKDSGDITVPVYLNSTRKNMLFSIKLKSGKIPTHVLYQRGVALVACSY